MDIGVRQISPLEFDSFYGSENRLGAYYARNIGGDGFILSAFRATTPLGYAICKAEGSGRFSVRVVYVIEEHRRSGVASRLFDELEKICSKFVQFSLDTIKICLAEDSEGFDFKRASLVKRGYSRSDKVYVFLCDEDGYSRWEEYMRRRGNGLIKWIEDMGYSAVPFEDAPTPCLDTLRAGAGNEYGNSLDIAPFLDGKRSDFLKDASFAAIKDGRPTAYCLVTGPDRNSALFEQISVAMAHKNTGVLLLPLSMSMRRVKELGYKRAVYAIYEDNSPALVFAERILGKVTGKKKTQYNFEKKFRGGG
ncbi:hypothetical protein AGMMS50276_20190 [Synergistales bacterium]|nr:hypothetical protein AGMMS50276_20190 [Synergistales bacterium]